MNPQAALGLKDIGAVRGRPDAVAEFPETPGLARVVDEPPPGESAPNAVVAIPGTDVPPPAVVAAAPLEVSLSVEEGPRFLPGFEPVFPAAAPPAPVEVTPAGPITDLRIVVEPVFGLASTGAALTLGAGSLVKVQGETPEGILVQLADGGTGILPLDARLQRLDEPVSSLPPAAPNARIERAGPILSGGLLAIAIGWPAAVILGYFLLTRGL